MEMKAEEERRYAEIEGLFDQAGRRLLVSEQDGTWEAMVPIKHFGSWAPAAYDTTPLAAAEAAWAIYRSEPQLGGEASDPAQ